MQGNIYCEKTKAILSSANAATELVRDNDGLVSHINVFLYDTSMTKNGSMLTEAVGDASAKNFYDLPFIVTESLGHNVFPEDPTIMPDGGVFNLVKPVSEYIKASRRFEVGRVVNVIKKYLGAGNSKEPVWTASIKLTDKKFRKFITKLADKYADIKQAKLFVSSFLAGTAVASADGWVYDGPVKGMHIALVKSPAYDNDKSMITGICIGDDLSCAKKLATAASYSNINTDQSLIEFNNELLAFSRSLYLSGSASSDMSEEENKQAVKTPDKEKEEPKDKEISLKESEFNEMKKQIAELKKLAEKSEEKEPEVKEDKPEGDKDIEAKERKKLEARIQELEREKKINQVIEKLKAIPKLDIKIAKKQAEVFVDKNYTDKEVDEFINSFAPTIKASGNSNKEVPERSTDALLTKFEIASASSYQSYDDVTKKQSNKAVNLGSAEFLSHFLKA